MEGGETIALLVRAAERLVIVAGGITLIIIGYVTLRRRARREAQGEISLQHTGLGGLIIRNHGPGFLALALGAALLAFTLAHGTIEIDPQTRVIKRFFNKTDADRARYAAEITQLRFLEDACRRKALPGIVDCATLTSSRKGLATAYFPEERVKFDAARPGGPEKADSQLTTLFGD